MTVATLRLGSVALLVMLAGPAFAQGYQATLQISPQGGGHCIDVPNRQFVRDQGLQVMDCDNSPSQIFTYDPAKMSLAIGGLCIDASGGKPADLVKLQSCDGGANQVWKAEQKGGFTKFVGVNGHCLDIRYGSTAAGALVQSWNCGDAEPNQLWSLQRK